jgi:hypothetical protein
MHLTDRRTLQELYHHPTTRTILMLQPTLCPLMIPIHPERSTTTTRLAIKDRMSRPTRPTHLQFPTTAETILRSFPTRVLQDLSYFLTLGIWAQMARLPKDVRHKEEVLRDFWVAMKIVMAMASKNPRKNLIFLVRKNPRQIPYLHKNQQETHR